MEKLYQYIVENYQTNEPIFLADIQIEGMKDNNIQIGFTAFYRKGVGI